jgi:hypothetical protein
MPKNKERIEFERTMHACIVASDEEEMENGPRPFAKLELSLTIVSRRSVRLERRHQIPGWIVIILGEIALSATLIRITLDKSHFVHPKYQGMHAKCAEPLKKFE